MSFTTKQDYFNIYEEHKGTLCTCKVCGKSWIESFRNDCWNEQRSCGHIALIKEWDGSQDLVHFTDIDSDVEIQYQDGLVHRVSKEYFNNMVLHIYR